MDETMNQTMNETAGSEDFAGDTKSLIYTIIMTSLGSVGLCFSAIAVLVLQRTRRTPETARFLHSGLFTLNMAGLIFLMSRGLLFANYLEVSLRFLGHCFVTLAFSTIAFMSVERLVLFAAPYFYVRVLTSRKVKITAYIFWMSFTTLYLLVRFGLLFLTRPSSTIVKLVDNCDQTFRLVHSVVMCIAMTAIIGSYVQIYRIESSKKAHDESERKTCLSVFKRLLHYRSTSIVILSVFTTITISLSLYFLERYFFNNVMLGHLVLFDIHSLIASITDPFLYAIWFKECRYELMKLFTRNAGYNAKLERMRMEIYNIVVKDDQGVDHRNI